MRTRTVVISVSLAVLALFALCTSTLLTAPGPRFGGKSINWYVRQMNLSDDGATGSQERWQAYQAAAKALRQMGPPAVTWLAQRLERKERPSRQWYRSLWKAVPPLIRGRLPRPGSESLFRSDVLRALIEIGPGAVPVLTNYLDSARYTVNTRLQIYNALTGMDLRRSPTDAIPILEHNLTLTNESDRVLAAYTIAKLTPDRTEQMVSILREALLVKDRRNMAATYFWNLGRAAEAAAPDLEMALNDPDPAFREQARVALQRVTGRHIPRR